MLRHIRQCKAADIAIKPEDLRFGNAVAKRVARIAAPHRYSLIQQLAQVFADIGLPASFQNLRKTTSERFFAEK
jgi:hypothetical protein